MWKLNQWYEELRQMEALKDVSRELKRLLDENPQLKEKYSR